MPVWDRLTLGTIFSTVIFEVINDNSLALISGWCC